MPLYKKLCNILETNNINSYTKINIIQAVEIAEYIVGEIYDDLIVNLFKTHGYERYKKNDILIPLSVFIIFIECNYLLQNKGNQDFPEIIRSKL